MSVSPCGKYLAASCRDGNILIWELSSRKCLTRYLVFAKLFDIRFVNRSHKIVKNLFIFSARESHPKNLTITGLAWNPKGNRELAFVDSVGNVGLLEKVLGSADGASQVRAQVNKSRVLVMVCLCCILLKSEVASCCWGTHHMKQQLHNLCNNVLCATLYHNLWNNSNYRVVTTLCVRPHLFLFQSITCPCIKCPISKF